ncbi:ABC transporter substrate-binding protein [Longimicrobium terrae]|uniref:Branched-chain amino acid transport system substrate-binding protein n=1 Tax=Longimicrobium terrae TaxID=1639882 RepID=A0A841H158_9BACT|nr:ABC transporter substrate-binding protein [Longimicrobium terrae]MBB4637339.1 branched-chain amino acid transport system substrate-binding protein [Longimicrobium terrae]MBB6071737.1 branched-chain amino acid transport system substrate-binding protein [Longimicrobium terrae]NNC28498.1 ABC transporter substrate-binding protein [Longimicrobium terrae]
MTHPDPGSRQSRAPRAALGVLLCGACLLAGCTRSGGGLVLGLAIPLTDGAGKPDPYGVRSRMGAELAVAEINAAGGIAHDSLRLRVVDDHGDPSTAPEVADRLVNDPAVLAVVGHVYSGTTLKAAERYDGHLAALATSATSPEISRLGGWIYRMASSDSANAVALARAARQMGRRIGVLYSNDDYGQGLARNFISALRQERVEVLEADPFLDATPDFRPYLRRMQSRGVDLVFVAGLQEPAARAITQAREIGITTRFLGGDGIEGLAEMGSRFDGTTVGVLFHPQMSDSARAFTARFRARFGQNPDSQAALAYDAVRLMARALRGGARTPGAVRAYLETVGRGGGSDAFEGAAGTVKFDSNGDPVDKRFTLGVIGGGGIQLPEAAR